ncbi:MAG: tetratricopeptide repeat protein [Scytonematopsis contorta HA4267-MV1]|jgi:tetratricopeptide (TPR) repeat protein|nr:tetratricopeptide repeat protein [Scytonematopsis contorta HA4267-MV1]
MIKKKTVTLFATTLITSIFVSIIHNPLANAYRPPENLNYASSDNNTRENYLNIFAIAGISFTVGISAAFILTRRTPQQKKFHKKKNLKALEKRNTTINSKIYTSSTASPSPYKNGISSSYIYIQRACDCVNQGDIEGALAYFERAINSKPNSPKIYSERANFRKNKLGDRQGAIEDYTMAIEMTPDNAMLYFLRSQTYQELGNQQKAIEDYNTAMSLTPQGTIYYSYREKNYREYN